MIVLFVLKNVHRKEDKTVNLKHGINSFNIVSKESAQKFFNKHYVVKILNVLVRMKALFHRDITKVSKVSLELFMKDLTSFVLRRHIYLVAVNPTLY